MAEALRETIDAAIAPAEDTGYERALANARAALGEAGFAAAWATGQALSTDQAVAEALAG